MRSPRLTPGPCDRVLRDNLASLLVRGELPSVPVNTLIILTVVLLIVVGPVERVLLRRRRRLHYTWWLCPTMALLFAILMFVIGYEDLDRFVRLRELHVVDLDIEGRAYRENTYRLVLSSTERSLKEVTRRGSVQANAASTLRFLQRNAEGDARFQTTYTSKVRARSATWLHSSQFGECDASRDAWPEAARQQFPWLEVAWLVRSQETDRDHWQSVLKDQATLGTDFHFVRRHGRSLAWSSSTPLWVELLTSGTSYVLREAGVTSDSNVELIARSLGELTLPSPLTTSAGVVCMCRYHQGDIFLYRCVIR